MDGRQGGGGCEWVADKGVTCKGALTPIDMPAFYLLFYLSLNAFTPFDII